ncbi:MAG: outer membrane beta-barrel family protein, partial [Ginsengibacter sp.]
MHKTSTLLTCIFFLSVSTFAQGSKVSGSVNDPDENKPVQNAVIALVIPKDSILYKFTRSNAEGKYILKDVKPGKYILMTTHPYFADLLEDIEIKGDAEIPRLALLSKSKILQEVIIKTGKPIQIKGDTTVYTADSFKVSANANVEELLRKLPGIQVDKDGKIKAMGETVEKVLVDGEEFFGDDPGMAVKNLRADAVKEVQVFDKKSDQSEFTGIDDGKTQKTIDLKLKEDKKKGYFGKIDVAGGLHKNIDDRYNDNLLFSSFKGKRKLSAFLLNGNTNQDGLSWQDEQKYGGQNENFTMNLDDDGELNFMWRGNTVDDEPNVDPQNGYITNVNAGVQYSNKWNDKRSFNFSPKYNSQDYTNHRQTFSQTQLGDSALIENSDLVTNVNRHNFKLRGIYDIKIDSMNTLKITANTNFYHTESEETRTAISTGNAGTLKNSTNRFLQTNNDKNALSGNIIFRHKFKTLRRTFSITADWSTLNTDGTNFLKSVNQAYLDGSPAGNQQLNQLKNYDRSSKSISSKIVYTEPLGKKYSLQLGYQLSFNNGNNDQLTYSYSPVSLKYDFMVDSLSNKFKQNILQNIPSAKFNYSTKKLKINAGAGVGFTSFDLKDISYNKDYHKGYTNFFPSASLNYSYKSNRNIRFNYDGNTTQPTLNQLQPLRNNNDYFNQYIGNPALKPSFTNSFNLSHQSYNFIKDVFSYQDLSVRLINNSITNNRIINIDSGKTITQPINTNGNLSVNLYSYFGFKFKKIDTRLNIGPSFGYYKYADFINSTKTFSTTFNPGVSVWLSKAKEKKYEFSIDNNLAYNSNNTSQNNTKVHYYTNTLSFFATVYSKKVWSVISDYRFFTRQKTPQFNSNLNSHIWNVRFQRTFKQNEFTAYFVIRDLLNQNVGVERNFYNNTFIQETNDRIRRYFLVGFTWDFKNK